MAQLLGRIEKVRYHVRNDCEAGNHRVGLPYGELHHDQSLRSVTHGCVDVLWCASYLAALGASARGWCHLQVRQVKKKGVLQNTSICAIPYTSPSIKIVEGDHDWNDAYQNWLLNKPPTDNPLWKRGVWFHYE